jgi:hypothetical protein
MFRFSSKGGVSEPASDCKIFARESGVHIQKWKYYRRDCTEYALFAERKEELFYRN